MSEFETVPGASAEPVAWAYERYLKNIDRDEMWGWHPRVTFDKPEACFNVRNIRPLYAHPPAQAAKDGGAPIILDDTGTRAVAEAIENGGWWHPCTGCHETNEGYETGDYPYSEVLRCYVGAGCSECGGLGVVWEQFTEADEADLIAEMSSPATVTPAGDESVGDLAALSAKVAVGEWWHELDGDPDVAWFYCITDGATKIATEMNKDEAEFIVTLVNAYRIGRLIEAPAAPQATDGAVEALRQLEDACDRRAALLTSDEYIKALDGLPGMAGALEALDSARRRAREIIRNAPSRSPGHRIIEATDCIGVRGASWALTVEWPDGSETLEHVSDHGARVLGYRFDGEDAAPAAPRHAPSEEEIAGLIRQHVRLEWRGHDNADINPRSVTSAAEAIRALLITPDRGETRGEEPKPYTLQSGEGGTFLQAHAGQLFICADIGTVRRCLTAIGAPVPPGAGGRA